MKKKLLRCISILCTAAMLFTSHQTALVNVQAETIFDDETIWDDDSVKDDRLVSKDGCFQYRLGNDGTVTIVGYIGENEKITIPAEIDGKKVSQIGMHAESEYAFLSENKFVKEITFPQGIHIRSTLAPNIEKISFSKEKSESFTSILIINCPNLKEADLRQESHLKIEGISFLDCKSLKKVYLPSSIQFSDFSDSTFCGCTGLTDVYFDGTESQWAYLASRIGDESSLLKAKKHFVAKDGTTNYSKGYYGKELSTPIKECSFNPSSIRTQKTFKIPNTVVLYKGGNPVKVTEIFQGGGENNTTTSIVIGKYVTYIGFSAFEGWSKLKKITIKSTKLSGVGPNAFKDIHPNAVIKVPAKKLTAYKKLFKNFKVKVTAI